MQTSQANVKTARPERYGKQLASHFSRKVEASWDEDASEGAITFPAPEDAGEGTTCSLAAGEEVLHMRIDGTADAVERVVGTHLVRFGARDGLAVQWQRGDGPGQSFTASEPEPPSQ